MMLSGNYRFVSGQFRGVSGDLNREELGLVYVDPTYQEEFTVLVERTSISGKTLRSECPKAKRESTANGRFFCLNGSVGVYVHGALSYGVLVPLTVPQASQQGARSDPRLAFASMALSSLR